MKAFVAVVLCFVLATHSVCGLQFVGNVTFKAEDKQDWEYRSTTCSWSAFYNQATFTSTSVTRTPTSIYGDQIIGGITYGMSGIYQYPPGSFLTFWDYNKTVNYDDDIYSFDVTTSGGYIATSYLALYESAPNGTILSGFRLNKLSWTIGDKDTSASSTLKYVSFNGTAGKYYPGLSVSLVFILASNVGVVDLAGAVVSPKALEAILIIENYPYQSPSNSLTLAIASATGVGYTSDELLVAGSGVNQTYFQVNTSAVINGEVKGVKIKTSVSSDVTILENPSVEASITSRYGAAISASLYNITFPAGAESIVYDPTQGSGTPLSTEDSGSASGAARLVVCWMVIVVLLLAL